MVAAAYFFFRLQAIEQAVAAADGLRWKIWAIDAENSQFSGILFFDTPSASAMLGCRFLATRSLP